MTGPSTSDLPRGLLIELSSPPAEKLDEFNEWYNAEYLSSRLAVAGFRAARRYSDAELPGALLVAYDLDDPAILDQAEYLALRRRRSEREQSVVEQLLRLERRSYRLLGSYESREHTIDDEGGRFLLAVWWEPARGYESELDRWYEEEHIPLLLSVPGWIRVRRYLLVEGLGPRFLAMHDLADLGAFAWPEHQVAASTPWRSQVIEHREQFERRIFSLARP